MRRDTWIQLGAGAALVVLLAVSAALSTQIAASAGRNKLVYTDTIEQGGAYDIAIALGAFKGIFVNYLWIRANDLKEEGKYHEAIDLASTITKLQPRFPRVWSFHAWNLAYNISVVTQTPSERWQWVQAGIRLLRDEGIPANPNDLLIHKELAWIFLHKVQGIMDDSNQYYKQQHCREWTIVLGPPPRRNNLTRTTEEAIADHVEWLRRLVDAKNSIDEVYTTEPKARELVERLKAEAGLDALDFRLYRTDGAMAILELAEEQRSLDRVYSTLGMMLQRNDANEAAIELTADPQYLGAWRELIPFIRNRVLIDIYKMEPERMLRYTEKFGPLDWRHPAAHAVYWSARGVEQTLQRMTQENKSDFDILNTDRVTIQAIQELYRSGDVIYDLLNPEFLLQLPNPNYIQVYAGILDELIDRSPFAERTRVYSMYSAGYENFLRDAIRFLYRRGDVAEAKKYHEKLLTFPNLTDNDPFKLLALSAPIDEFVVNEITKDDRFTTPNVAKEEVVGALQSAFVTGLLGNNPKVYKGQMDYARAFHKLYTDKQVFETTASMGIETRMEIMGRNFDEFAGEVFTGVIIGAGIPDGPIMYSRASTDLQLHAYVRLENSFLKDLLAAADEGDRNMGFNAWFAPPPGIDAFRAQYQQQNQDRPRPGVELK
jgi:hypothetical protein